MLRLDDDIFSEDDGTVVNIKSNISKNQGLFTGSGISTPVVYNTIMKTFIPSGTVNEYSAFLGTGNKVPPTYIVFLKSKCISSGTLNIK